MSERRDEDRDQALFPRSIATAALIDRMRKAVEAKEETLTYTQLSDAIGDDVRGHRHNLETARRTIEREYGVRFQTITNVGLKWASESEVIKETQSVIRSVRRRCSRSTKRMVRC